jgi:hypothetical protein
MIALPINHAVLLRCRLTEVLPPTAGLEWRDEILELLDTQDGETGAAVHGCLGNSISQPPRREAPTRCGIQSAERWQR